jgi:hypothetical protein
MVPFGLANTPSVFMQTMAKLLYKPQDYCIIYLDNILIHSRGGKQAHLEVVTTVLDTLQMDN